MTKLNRPVQSLFTGIMCLALAACATGPRIDTLQAPGADYSRYETFSYASPLGTDRAGYASIISQQLVFSTRREMELRNFVYVEDSGEADLLLNFNAQLNDQIRTIDVVEPTFGPTFWDYRYGMYSPWPTYQHSTAIDQFTEGTVVIDLIDAQAERMIWEGRATGEVTERTRRDAAEELDKAVKAIFDRFPIPSSSR
ncbi:MAG: DUF4136 domain-containing protein [Wenzhouxiangella sp.]|jgi:hypothetical protein|nr:DUF4136 domain-containing protein [Wenzhouxiangella sp.]